MTQPPMVDQLQRIVGIQATLKLMQLKMSLGETSRDREETREFPVSLPNETYIPRWIPKTA